MSQLVLLAVGYVITCSDTGISNIAVAPGVTEEDYNYVCSICSISVVKATKHCGYCQKCVYKFDHHCKILNNCIGGLNYNYFICLIGVLEINIVFLLIHLGIAINYSEWNDQVGLNTLRMMGIIGIIINTVALIFTSHLIGFHIYITYIGISTYEYILRRRIIPYEGSFDQSPNKNSDEAIPVAPKDSAVMLDLKYSK